MLRQIGLDVDTVFNHPDIVVWRSIPERENCTLDAQLADGRAVRLHVKRYHAATGASLNRRGVPAEEEAKGIQALEAAQIPTVPLVAWGKRDDGRSFVITQDISGFDAADKIIAAGVAPPRLNRLLDATAELAAKLHAAALHHRDLYLCHFFAELKEDSAALKLIDAGRVRQLPRWPFRQRWIVKDLAQFWYSTRSLPITDLQRSNWLERYVDYRALGSPAKLRRAIERKAARIARHDRNLNATQVGRNISIPKPHP